MLNKEIDLLKSRIDRLNDKDFDLEAWKNHTIVILERIFGPANQKIKQIEQIEYDYSSWSLRDTSGNSSYRDTCKKLSKEILEAAISELEIFGLPKKDEIEDKTLKVILSALEDELKISQYKELVNVSLSDMKPEEKQKEISKILKGYGEETIIRIFSKVIANTDFPSHL